MKKNIILLLTLALWYSCNSLHAQQWSYNNPTLWYDVNTIEIPGPGTIVIGGGWETHDSVQVMFQSSDYGLTWNENNFDGPAPWNKSIAFSDAVNGFGVGYDGRIIATHDAGRNWGYPATPVSRDLNKIVYVAGTYYVAGGNKTRDSIQTILKSTDDGYTWDVIYDTYGPWLKSVFFTDTLKGIAVGDNGVILSTTNGGNTWASITAPVLRDFNAVTFINADTGFIAGGVPSGPCRRTILRTVNGGSDWSVLMDNTGGILKDISFADTQVGYTVGDSASVLKTTDGGLNWMPVVVDTNLTGNETFNAVKFHNRNFGVIGGKAGVLYIYQDVPVEVFTMGSSQVGTTGATLLGGINTHTKNARYSFVYSNRISFSSYDTTQGINIQSNSLIFISENIQGLSPNTTYYYYLKAYSASDTIYGDTLTFFTGTNPTFIFQTQDATVITTWRATLNGFINKFPVPVHLFFEYGHSPAFGSLVPAIPASLNDTLLHYIRSDINGLQANTRYYFRLKGVTDSGTFYTDTKMFDAVDLPHVLSPSNVTVLSLTSVRLAGELVNNGLPTTIKFEFGASALYGTEVNAIPDTTSGTGLVHTYCILNGLSPTTSYHFRVKAVNLNGTSYGEDFQFITGVPIAVTLPASVISLDSVQLKAHVNASSFPTTVKFEYGSSNLYGNEVNAVPGSVTGDTNVNVSYLLTGLTPATTYHFRIKAINSNGASYGEDVTYITGVPTVSTLQASNTVAFSAQLNGLVNANNFPTINKFEYGTSTSYGNEVAAIPDSAFGMIHENISYHLTGLLQNTPYHYRVKASNSNGTTYGEDMTFNTGAPSASTLPASNVSESSAQLNGLVNANNFPAANEFEYGTSTGYGTLVAAVPDSSTGTSNISISYLLSGLSPNSTFHYRVKATNIVGTNYGNDLMFTTGAPMSVSTSPATEITSGSVKLNGSIDAGGIPAAVKFEYGTTTAYGSEINAIPDSVSSTGSIDVYALPGGLAPNTTYHFRLEGANCAMTKFGEDMMFYTGQPEIPNFDFESWTIDTLAKPVGWTMTGGKITRYSPACSNNYAVKIENLIATQPGVILIGNSRDGQTFTGGIPFNARPDTLIGCFKYSIPANDTALIGLLLKKQGAVISFKWFEIFGNSNGNYKELKFPISYTLADNADSLILGLVVTDVRHIAIPQAYPMGGYLIADNIRFTGTTENIPNNDFENFVININYSPDSWYHDNNPVHPEVNAVSRVTDVQHGNYAVIVQNYVFPSDTIGGWLNSSPNWQAPGFSVNARHQSLTGYYKFLPENNDTMFISAFMYKNHSFIGGGNFQAASAVTDYTPFIINFFYDNSLTPDSGAINIMPYLNQPRGNSRLYVDNLNFDGFLSGIKETPLTATNNFDFNIYPNPFSDQATVSFTTNREEHVMVRLFDISGKLVLLLADCKYNAGNYKLDLSAQGLQKGFYICIISTEGRAFSRKLIIY